VAAIIFGGNQKQNKFKGLDLSNFNYIKRIFSHIYDKPLFKVIIEKTKKYRYDPEKETGGTFGGDYLSEKEFVPILNWQMPYISRDDRKKIYENIKKYYVDFFNKEAIETKKWTTCGEPCPAACKKIKDGFKVDYEPYNANGPLSGSLYLNASDYGVNKVDSLGFDAIEFGCLASWVFELLSKGLLKPSEIGLTDSPDFKYEQLINNPVKVSEKNSKLLCELAEKVAWGEGEIPGLLGYGKRKSSSYLDKKFHYRLQDGLSFKDYAVYVALGDDGEITPTLYWALGNFVPLPVQGKYWTYYKFAVFPEPEELANRIVESAVAEYWYDNVGWCRFHRRWMRALATYSCEFNNNDAGWCQLPINWTKSVLELLFLEAYGEKLNAEEHAKKQMRNLINYALRAGYNPVFPDSKRIIDLMEAGSREFGGGHWKETFKLNREKAAREYLSRVLNRYSEILNVDWKI
jgi:glyceraldehyde-3-phosphate dehydrogenase (ferredoxin)